SGPVDAPFMFERDDPAKFLLSLSGLDLPRNHEGAALIADPRNDSYLFISQLHVAFARLHNRSVDEHRRAGVEESRLFEGARRSTISRYRQIVLHEFLPLVIASSLTAELIENGTRFFVVGPDGPRVPVEFAAAAYRYGHAQVRPRYQVNAHFGPVPVFPDL